MKRIYLAGGWFTPEQEELHSRIYNAIKDKFNVFNPKIEGEIDDTTTHDKMSKILIGNIEGIKQADLVLVIYDYKDTGTIWEAGFSYAYDKPILYYSETLNGKKFNLMLAKTGNYVANVDELLERLNDSETFKFKNVYDDYKGEIE